MCVADVCEADVCEAVRHVPALTYCHPLSIIAKEKKWTAASAYEYTLLPAPEPSLVLLL